MAARHDDGFGERLERAIRTADRSDHSSDETPEAYGRRVADELFMKAVRSIEAKQRQH